MSAGGSPITFQVLAGPHGGTFLLDPASSTTIGRAAVSTICLLNEGVSRRHALVLCRGGGWFLSDQGSTAGTFLNGVRLPPDTPTPLANADIVRIGPWTFRVLTGDATGPVTTTLDDAGAAAPRIERVSAETAHSSGRRLQLLTELIARLQFPRAGQDESAMAHQALEIALTGSGYVRGAVLRVMDDGREVGVMTSVGLGTGQAPLPFSRSLIRAAGAGRAAVLTSDVIPQPGTSIAELKIHSALCAPVMLGDALAAVLYLDARGQETSVHPDAEGFCEAVASTLALALANLKRAELVLRQAQLTAELSAAREAQELILPPAQGSVGCVRYALSMRPGAFVAGDVFDVIPLAGSATAVCIGDVSGHGAGSALLMACVQSQVHAQLRAGADPAAALAAVNTYLCEHSKGRFASLWLGVFERDGTLRYVDAGHGHWLYLPRGGAPEPVTTPGHDRGLPVGVDPEARFAVASLRIQPGDRAIAYSDGIVDQRSPAGEEFGVERLRAVLNASESPAEDVRRILDAVDRFAGTSTFSDDATAASVEFTG